VNGNPTIGKTPSGTGWKVYVIGQPNSHFSDWRGSNMRIIPLPGQPSRGFTSRSTRWSTSTSRCRRARTIPTIDAG